MRDASYVKLAIVMTFPAVEVALLLMAWREAGSHEVDLRLHRSGGGDLFVLGWRRGVLWIQKLVL